MPSLDSDESLSASRWGLFPGESCSRFYDTQLSTSVKASGMMVQQDRDVREPISRLIWCGIGQVGFMLAHRIIGDIDFSDLLQLLSVVGAMLGLSRGSRRLRYCRVQRSARDLVQLWLLSASTKATTHGGILTVRRDKA